MFFQSFILLAFQAAGTLVLRRLEPWGLHRFESGIFISKVCLTFRRVLGLVPLGLCLFMGSWLRADVSANQFEVVAEGRLVPGTGLVVVGAASQAGVALVDTLYVQTGDTLAQGDVIARLKGYNLAESEIKMRQQAVVVAEAALETTQANVRVGEVAVKAAAAQVLISRQQEAQARVGVLSAQKAKAKALADHDAVAKNLQGQIAEYQRVIDVLKPSRREREELLLKQHLLGLEMEALKQSRSSLNEVLEVAIAEAEASVATAAAQVAVTEVAVETAKAQAQVASGELLRIKAEAELMKNQVALAKLRAENTIVRAPVAGRVLAVNTRPGEVVGQYGVAFLGNTEAMHVEAEVYIDDIRWVKVGQSAKVSGSALQTELSGTVTQVGLMVSPANVFNPDPNAFTDRRVVNVRIQLDASAAVAELTYAQVTIRITTREQAADA